VKPFDHPYVDEFPVRFSLHNPFLTLVLVAFGAAALLLSGAYRARLNVASQTKVPINVMAFIDAGAPTLPAREVVRRFTKRLRVWCKHCRHWHYHGPGEGHREPHCTNPVSPYHRAGYNLALAV
jgi:hypothetical protein